MAMGRSLNVSAELDEAVVSNCRDAHLMASTVSRIGGIHVGSVSIVSLRKITASRQVF